jgi:lipid-A-disaccharide synthase
VPRIAIVAGEASGDALAAGLIRAARELRPDVTFEGIAGPQMRAAGCDAWFPSEDLAVMGLVEVLRHLPRLARLRSATVARVRALAPAAYVGVDAPDFNLRIEGAVRRQGIRTVQYVCPSVWAWRQSRVRVLREACDEVLCLLPFEQAFLARHGVPGRFIGHPFADEIGVPDPAGARAALGLAAGPVVAVLPGSRHGEMARIGPLFAATVALLARDLPGLAFVAPMAAPPLADQFREELRQHAPGVPVTLLAGDARRAMAAADVVLVASGTATLEALLLERPMVVAYRLAPATYALARALRLVRLAHFSLPNLLAGRALVPEFLQGQATPEALAAAVLERLRDPAGAAALRVEFRRIAGEIRCNASLGAARAVLAQAGLAVPEKP